VDGRRDVSGSLDAKGNVPLEPRGLVLFSGGMDSTLALHWALMRYADVIAVAYDYGQPHRDAELCAADYIATKRGVTLYRERIMVPVAGLLTGVHDHDGSAGINRAFVPGRNLLFLAMALGPGIARWPLLGFDIVIGACAEDAGGFPDCRLEFFRAAEKALSTAVDRPVGVAAPFVKMTKAEALETAELRFPLGMLDAADSWSCYRGDGPCRKCTACVMRAQAFAARSMYDRSQLPRMTGGDVHRDRGLV
jgi:7-cyano-7-deazaguanine synthase